MLSPHFGLGRKEMGASVTACGRAITKFMIESIGEQLIGTPTKVVWYLGEQKFAGTGSSYNGKRTVCVVPRDETVCDVVLLSDTDSVVGTTIIKTGDGEKTIQSMFDESSNVILDSKGREFALGNGRTALGFDHKDAVQLPVKFVYRHKTKKKLYKISTESGRSITITEDHSLMVRRNGNIIEIKPDQINTDTDVCIGEKDEVLRM